jgi:bifunctional DNase/RNase
MSVELKEVGVASLGVDKSSSTPVVILKEKAGDRLLPIWIGPGEASAIAMELAGIQFSRPLTHDLFNAVVQGLGSSLERVLITRVVDNTYYASLVFRRNGELISIDSRPSDSIAIALRAEAPIYADEALLELSNLEVEETGFETEGYESAGFEEPESYEPPIGETAGSADEAAGEPLEDYLRRLNPEDFGRFEP